MDNEQRDAIEQRLDEKRAAELLNAGDSYGQDQDADDCAPHVDASRPDRGRAEKRADQRRQQVVQPDVRLPDLKLAASTQPVNATSSPDATNTPMMYARTGMPLSAAAFSFAPIA